jgi:hypothetical protein
VILVLGWLAINAAWLAMVVDAGRQPVEAYVATHRNKAATVALVFFTGWLGAFYYVWVVRPAIRRVEIAPVADDGTRRCLECGMSGFGADATRCTNCGSERLS